MPGMFYLYQVVRVAGLNAPEMDVFSGKHSELWWEINEKCSKKKIFGSNNKAS